ncbi:uncharacterized protein [Dermacentor andersoni]|uniref:uncharacterized protein isoform X3 n=1 Tax=Dermacentor andersoni TaxID=34620 RepID=UPI00241789D8|nr:uncharacterized protein LOC126528205 isoform X3 [Dermacentor andersoni]
MLSMFCLNLGLQFFARLHRTIDNGSFEGGSANSMQLPISSSASANDKSSDGQLNQRSLGIKTTFGNTGSSIIGGLPQRPVIPTGINGSRTIIESDAFRKVFWQQPGISPIGTNVGMQILRGEAPMIRVIETKIHEGREMERNLTAIRIAILRELSGATGIGVIRRFQIRRRLRELDVRLNELHRKNQEAEQKFRTFIGGVASGKIRDRRQARSILDNIYHFCGTVVAKLVFICRGVAGGLINLCKGIILGLANVIHGILGLKLRPLEAGVNVVAGI